MPAAAAANRSVFYDASGRARSLAEIYQGFAERVGAEAQRFARMQGPDASTPPTAAGDAPAFIRNPGFSPATPSPPVAAFPNLFALNLLHPAPSHPAPTTPARHAV